MTESGLVASIEARFPGAILAQDDRPVSPSSQSEPSLTLSSAHLVQVCEFLRDESEARYDLLVALIGASDRVCYQLASLSHRQRLRLCVPLPDERRVVDSLAFVWPAANWAEREAHDLWNVAFTGHPDLQPLLARTERDAGSPTASPGDALLTAGTRYPTSVKGLFIRLELDGQQIVKARPELGYRHVGLEKQLASWQYERGTLLAARVDGFSAMQGDLAYALAVEKLLDVEPPLRAQRLRVTYAELQRIASHLFWLARCAQNLSDPALAAPAYAWEGRIQILDLFQELGGNPITPDVIAVGGLARDAPPAFVSRLRRLLADLNTLLDDLDRLLVHSAAFRSRLDGIGIIDPGTAQGLGVTGPCLRATGVEYDVRSAFPYSSYESLDVYVPIERDGDAGARYRVRAAEMRASLDLIHQAMSPLPDGPVNAFGPGAVPSALPAGTAYASVEGARGELGVYLVADGSARLKRAHVRGPSFANLSALPFIARGLSADQAATALDSLDISVGEVER